MSAITKIPVSIRAALALLLPLSYSVAAKGYILNQHSDFYDRAFVKDLAKSWDYELVEGDALPAGSGRNIVLFSGSAGASALAKLVKADPGRIVAFAPFVLGTPNFGDAVTKSVPHMAFVGSEDGSQYREGMENWKSGSRNGGLYSWAVQWGAGHSMADGFGLSMIFFDRMIKGGNRDESKGWLGDFTTWGQKETGLAATIASYAEYKGDKNKAVWFPDRYLAHCWRAFVVIDGKRVKSGGNTTVVPPLSIVSPTDSRVNQGNFADVGSSIDVSVIVSKAEIRTLEVYDGDILLQRFEDIKPGAFKVLWKNVSQGPHGILAVGYDAEGKAYSSPLNVMYAFPWRKGTIPHAYTGPVLEAPAGSPNFTTHNVGGSELPKWNWPIQPQASGRYSASGAYTIEGNGIGCYWCWDRMPYGHMRVSGDFVMTAKLKNWPKAGAGTDLQNASAGIAVKTGLDPRDPVLSLRWDTHWENTGSTGLAWFNRITPPERISVGELGEKGEKLGQGLPSCWEGCLGLGYENRVEGFKERKEIELAVQRKNLHEYYLYARYSGESAWLKVDAVSAGKAPWDWNCGTKVRTRPHFEVPNELSNDVLAGVYVAGIQSKYGDVLVQAEFSEVKLYQGAGTHAFPGAISTQVQPALARESWNPAVGAGWYRTRPGAAASVKVYDLGGRLKAATRESETAWRRLWSGLGSGAYLVEMESEGARVRSRLVR